MLIHFLPYGFKTLEQLNFSKRDTNILVFHDEIPGLSDYGHFRSTSGIPREILDQREFALVLGGHIHLRQELAFQNCPALHIGTPLERIQEGDQGPKGMLIVDIDKEIHIKFVESPFPKIKSFVARWKGDIDEIIATTSEVNGNVIQLTVEHDGSAGKALRKELLSRLFEGGAASAQVKLRAVFAAPLLTNATVHTRLSIGDQIIEYARQVDNDPTLLSHLQEIRRRGDGI